MTSWWYIIGKYSAKTTQCLKYICAIGEIEMVTQKEYEGNH